ncbi:hypothetical protein [Streptomyces sp. NPDC060187]|uniref:hypothetical protein n=1 Tax=Streptomyces sp. NPDC060187 TaxID=3347067 RepID=UPI00365A3BD6
MEWLVSARLHPRASGVTVTVARDLAERMDYDSGQVRYCLEGMVARLGLSRATVSRQVAYLRELGSLVWIERGSRTNARRARGLGGYAGTATVYGAVIPAVYDRAHGHTLVGSGYTARIVVDERGRSTSPARAEVPVDNSPVDKSCSEALETPSRTWLRKEGQVKEVGGCNYSPRKGASRSKARLPHQSSSIGGRRRTASDVRRAERTVRLVRALVSWTQPVPLRRLEYVLRPLTDRGLGAHEVAAELSAMCSGMRWRPTCPDVFIAQRLSVVAAFDQQLSQEIEVARRAVAPTDSADWTTLMLKRQRARAAAEAAARPRTDADRARARANWDIWPLVVDRYAEDPDDALDLYGLALVQFAIGQAGRLQDADRC